MRVIPRSDIGLICLIALVLQLVVYILAGAAMGITPGIGYFVGSVGGNLIVYVIGLVFFAKRGE